MSLAAATRLGPYEILAPLGAGGMGEVYRARDERLGRDVAIKVLPSHLALDQVALARFERETRAVAALSHPNILSIFDVGQEAGVAFAVTELLEGETLRDRLRAGPLPLRKALEYGAQVAQGLAAAHQKGIVHRDLKPENVFLTPDGRAKVLDFGLAKPSADKPNQPDEATLVLATDPGMVAGTPAYMAPEQVMAQPVTPQTDIFALGSLLFEMLSGQRAFQGQTPVETMTAVLREDPPDLATLAPAVPPAVAALVRHCLEKQTAERFQSARDVAFHLQSLAGAPTPSQPRQPALGAEADTPAPVPGAGRWLKLAIAGAGVVAAAAAFAAGFWVGDRPVPAPRFTRVSFTPKVIYRAAFTPQKDQLVYSAAASGNRPVVYQLGSEYPSARPLDLPPDTHLLSVSRSGELALLVNAHVVTGSIMVGTLARAPLGAGVPRGLLDNVRDADWVGSGQELAIVRGAGDKDRLEFPPGHVLYETDGYLSELRAAPDGTRFAAFEHPMKWEAPAALVVVDLQGRKSVLGGEYPFTRGLAWAPGGEEILFGASSGGAGNTAILAATLDGKVRQVVEGAGSLTVHDASGTNEWLVSRDDLRVGVRALAPGETTERELSWLDRSAAAALSGDGRSLLFTELAPPAGASGSACLRGTNGGPVLTLGAGFAQDLSRDGSMALAIIHRPPQLLVYSTGVGEKRTLPRGGIQQYRWASWFADGRRVAVCGMEAGRASRCYVQALDGTPPQPVTPAGDWALASPDGRRLLVWKPGAELLIYGVGGGPAERVASATAEDMPAGWTPDGRGVFVHRPQQVPGQIDRIDLGSGRRERAWQFSPSDHVGLLSFDPVMVAADGASYTYSYTRILSTLFKVEFPK